MLHYAMASNVTWDEDKRRENIERRGVDFGEAALIFEGDVVESVDARRDYGEVRYRALGRVEDQYYMVAYTWRGDNRHIITAWKVGEHGRRRYEEILSGRA